MLVVAFTKLLHDHRVMASPQRETQMDSDDSANICLAKKSVEESFLANLGSNLSKDGKKWRQVLKNKSLQLTVFKSSASDENNQIFKAVCLLPFVPEKVFAGTIHHIVRQFMIVNMMRLNIG